MIPSPPGMLLLAVQAVAYHQRSMQHVWRCRITAVVLKNGGRIALPNSRLK